MSNVLTKIPDEPLLYVSKRGYIFLRKRDTVHGVDTHVSLKTKSRAEARKHRQAYYNARVAHKLGLAHHPNRPRAKVKECLEIFAKAGYPDGDGNKRPENEYLSFIKRTVTLLDEHFGKTAVEDLDQDGLDGYRDWRVKNVKQGNGLRTVDRGLAILSNALDWAKRKKKIKQNPITDRAWYHKASKSRHAKDVAPTSSEEVHSTAAVLFNEGEECESMGWQYVWSASTGTRRSEILRLRADAGPGVPGYVRDGKYFCMRPSKQKEINPLDYITLRPDQKITLEAHQAWLKKKYPKAKWWFPGRYGTGVISKDSLGHKLDELYKAGKLPRKLTPQGARSHYVLMRRSWGVQDSVIAAEIHHRGDLKTLIQVYGMVPSGWLDKPPRFKWLPRRPAWLMFKMHRAEKCSTGEEQLPV